MTIPKGRNANNAERLEVVLPEKGSVAVRFKANCADQFVPRSPKWTHANGVETGPEVVIEFHKAGLQAIAFDTGNKEHWNIEVDVRQGMAKTIRQDVDIKKMIAILRGATETLNEVISSTPTPLALEFTPPKGIVWTEHDGWKELRNSPKTFDAWTYGVGLNPAFGVALKARTPSPIPSFMKKYIKAEAYVKLGFETNLDVGYKYQSNKAGTDVEGSWAAGSSGSASVALSVGAEIKAGDWISAELVGESKGTIAFVPDNNNEPCLDLNYELQPLVCCLKVEMKQGEYEYSQDWEVFDKQSGELVRINLRELVK